MLRPGLLVGPVVPSALSSVSLTEPELTETETDPFSERMCTARRSVSVFVFQECPQADQCDGRLKPLGLAI